MKKYFEENKREEKKGETKSSILIPNILSVRDQDGSLTLHIGVLYLKNAQQLMFHGSIPHSDLDKIQWYLLMPAVSGRGEE